MLINGQDFINSKVYGFDSFHKARPFYNKLKNDYCKRRGFVMCEKWLDYQKFCKWWDENKQEGKKVTFNQTFKVIDDTSVYFR